MKKHLVTSIVMTIVTTLLLGVAYPLIVTALAQLLFPKQANGSLITANGKIVGSRIIGQPFSSPGYFRSRPSAAASDILESRFQEAPAFHAVQQRVESSGADAVAVTAEFLHHGQAEDGLVQRVDQHVNADQPGKQVSRMARLRQWSSDVERYVISNFDVMIRSSR